MLIQCQEPAPAIVLLFAPPYYLAVNTSKDPLVIEFVQLVKKVANNFGAEVEQIYYSNGLYDLSYVHYKDDANGWEAFASNTPVWGEVYSISFADMLLLQAPMLNVGPFRKDAHQLTERLHIESAFVHTPAMFDHLIKSLIKKTVEV